MGSEPITIVVDHPRRHPVGVMVASVALLMLALPLRTILFFASASAAAVRAADANAARRSSRGSWTERRTIRAA